ncbi:MAG: SET domain-containing protein-lysine N-methyltransferase [Candidatus Roizmanbacteria bacterium]|nr:SET domain-containing protein-lysine N-methyltransferase [Candidatus Roizmanbacteria bacterium]MCR4313143.1 SET domain-containing protein-lysine N-methyltransferase [Candidatus Roizmanbacteria bacterium]
MNLPFKIKISPTLKIRGNIATRNIKKNTIIEKCPVILIETKYEDFLEKTKLSSYYFIWNKKYHCIVLGYGGIFNHSKNNNTKYYPSETDHMMYFKTVKDVKKGEELMTDYYDGDDEEIISEFTDFHKKISKIEL